MTSFAGANNDLAFTDARATSTFGTNDALGGGVVSISYVDPGANNQALSVSTVVDGDGNALVTVNLATNGSGAITTTASDVLAAINSDASASLYVSAALAPGNSGVGVVTALANSNLTAGVDATGIAGLQTTAANGEISLIAGGTVTISEGLTANGSGNITVQSYSGAIALASGVSTTGDVVVLGLGSVTRTAGTISGDDLWINSASIGTSTAAIRSNVNRLEAYATNGGLYITEVNGLTLGGITNSLTQALQTGGNGDIELRVNAGTLAITEGIRTQRTGVTRLRAAGNITQTGNLATMGGIVSSALGVVADAGTVSLAAAANDVNHLAASATTSGQSVYFYDLDDLYTNEVTAGGVFAGTVTGVTGGHDVELNANGYLAAERTIQAGSGASDTVRLQSVTDSVGQTAQGTIFGTQCSAQAGKFITLGAANDVDIFAAAASFGPVVFNDVDGYTTGTVPGGVLITNSVTGITP